MLILKKKKKKNIYIYIYIEMLILIWNLLQLLSSKDFALCLVSVFCDIDTRDKILCYFCIWSNTLKHWTETLLIIKYLWFYS